VRRSRSFKVGSLRTSTRTSLQDWKKGGLGGDGFMDSFRGNGMVFGESYLEIKLIGILIFENLRGFDI
jgi:hypothetical protein